MKKIGFILFAVILSVSALSAQNIKAPKAEFDTIVHDFGKIKEEVKVANTTFKFTNVGNAPLIIQRAISSCGCTTPTYTKKPILPKEEGEINVGYSTVGRPGVFSKNITIFTNVPDEVYVLTIKGEVIRQK